MYIWWWWGLTQIHKEDGEGVDEQGRDGEGCPDGGACGVEQPHNDGGSCAAQSDGFSALRTCASVHTLVGHEQVWGSRPAEQDWEASHMAEHAELQIRASSAFPGVIKAAAQPWHLGTPCGRATAEQELLMTAGVPAPCTLRQGCWQCLYLARYGPRVSLCTPSPSLHIYQQVLQGNR